MTNHAYAAVPPPLRQEVAALARQYRNVEYVADERVVRLDVELGSGWTPRVVSMELRLPRGYPQTVPRVVLPWELRCHGSVPRPMLSSGHWLIRGQLGDNILYFPSWDQAETLQDVADTVVAELNAHCTAADEGRLADA